MKFLKLFLLLSSGVLIASGWIQGVDVYAISGAFLFLTILCINIASLIRDSLKYRTGHYNGEANDKKLLDNFISILEGLIVLSGLITMLSDDPLFKIPGMIIWIGTLSMYALSGVVVSSITNLPLKMGYGGWYISRRRRK